jgi:hypothetical protein
LLLFIKAEMSQKYCPPYYDYLYIALKDEL